MTGPGASESPFGTASTGKAKFAGPKGWPVALVRKRALNAAMRAALKLSVDQLKKKNSEALAKKDYMTAVLTRFRLDLDEAQERRILLLSRK